MLRLNHQSIFHEFKDDISALLLCDAINSSYVNSELKQVLKVVHMKSKDDINVIEFPVLTFHSFKAKELFNIELRIETLEGRLLEFINEHDNPIVYTLVFI